MTTFVKLSSQVTQAAAPFSFGVGFKKGDIPVSLLADTANYQVVVKRRWNDGSVKRANVAGHIALTATVQATITLSPGTPPTGTALTAASIATAAPTASVQCGALGTVQLADLLAAAPFRTWTSGPKMVNCIYRASIPGTLLAAFFDVMLFDSGACRVLPWVENGYLDNGAGAVATRADATYIPTFTVGGVITYNNGGVSLTHCKQSRVVDPSGGGWIGSANPQVTPQHDVVYLRASKLVPNYSLSNPNEARLNGLNQAYVPMVQGAVPFAMAAPGANASIALLPANNAAYLGGGDARAYRSVIASSLSMNSFALCWRDFTTKDTLKPSAFPNWSIYGPAAGGDRGYNLSNGSQWEINHHPGECYLAALLTDEFIHYDTMLAQVAFMYIARGSSTTGMVVHGNGTSRIIVHETRGAAWFLRSISQLCGFAPDDDLGAGAIAAEYRTLLASNANYWKATSDRPGINQLGYLYEYAATGLLNGYGDGWNPPWQQHWWMQALGFGSDLEPLADMTNFVHVRNWLYKGIVGILGAYGVDFPYAIGSVYNTKISNGTSLNPDTWMDTWAEVATATLAHIAGGYAGMTDPGMLQNGGDMAQGNPVPAIGGSGDPSDADFGRWGYLLPAISYAAEHGAPGAAESWARITGASNYTTLTGAGFDQQSQWGVFPRSVSGATMPAVPCYVMDTESFLVSGFVMDTNRTNGMMGSEIPTGFAQPHPLAGDPQVGDPVDTRYAYEVSIPPAGMTTFTVNQDGSITATGPDGEHVGQKITKKNGARTLEAMTVQIGAASVTAPGATLTGTAQITGGAASASAPAAGVTAPGATLTGTAMIAPGAATGGVTAPVAVDVTAPGATLTGSATLTPGEAMGNTAPTIFGVAGPRSKARTFIVSDPQVMWDSSDGTGVFWNMSNPAKPRGIKDPQAVIDIPFDWRLWFSDVTDTYALHQIVLTNGLVLAATNEDAGVITAFVAGGALNMLAGVTCRVATASTPPRIEERTVFLRIKDR